MSIFALLSKCRRSLPTFQIQVSLYCLQSLMHSHFLQICCPFCLFDGISLLDCSLMCQMPLSAKALRVCERGICPFPHLFPPLHPPLPHTLHTPLLHHKFFFEEIWSFCIRSECLCYCKICLSDFLWDLKAPTGYWHPLLWEDDFSLSLFFSSESTRRRWLYKSAIQC